MYKFSYVFALILLFSYTSFSQKQPEIKPTEDDDVVKITTNLIQVDVVVTDKKGNPVSNLKPEDFQIRENGEQRDITQFSYISAAPREKITSAKKEKNRSSQSVDIPKPEKKLRPEQVRRAYALVVDDLGLSFSSTFWVKKALKKFINEQMREGDLVAIVKTGGGMGALQSFTSDKEQLLKIADKLKWNASSRSGVNIFEPIRTSLKEDLQGKKDSDGNVKSVEGIDEDNEFKRQINDARRRNISVGSLGALNYIIQGMKQLPGRKSVIFLSEGFVIRESIGDTEGLSRSNDLQNAMRLLTDVANRASVVIYTIDPRGLLNPLMPNASDDIRPLVPSGYLALGARSQMFRSSQDSLRYLAEETGGTAFLNQNNIDKGLRKVIEDQSYYLIGYEPDEETFDPNVNKYNKLTVKVDRPGLEVRYRSGFFAVADNKKTSDLPTTTPEKIKSVLMSPFAANEIDLRLYSLVGNDKKRGDFIKTLVNISAKDLKFSKETNGSFKASLDIVAFTTGVDGKMIDFLAKNYEIKMKEETYRRALNKGIIYEMPLSVKKSGGYQVRVALVDNATGKVASASEFVDVPKIKKSEFWLSNLLLLNTPIQNGSKESVPSGDAYSNSTHREFSKPTKLLVGGVIYNAKLDNGRPNISVQIRLIKDGKIVTETERFPAKFEKPKDPKRIDFASSITIGNDMMAGDYLLQVIVWDEWKRNKTRVSSQWIDFEIVNN